MNIEEMKAELWGSHFGNVPSELIKAVPSVRHDKINRYLGLTKVELNALLSIGAMQGIGLRNLIAFIPALHGQQGAIKRLRVSEYIREELKRGKHSYSSSRKFYLTGKGKEIVRTYYELMK